MSRFDLGLLPSGHLRSFSVTADTTDSSANALHMITVGKAFTAGVGEGLFTLAVTKSDADLSPALQYCRNFARKYLRERYLPVPVDTQRFCRIQVRCVLTASLRDFCDPHIKQPRRGYPTPRAMSVGV